MRRVLVPFDIALHPPARDQSRLIRLAGCTMGTTWQVDARVPEWASPDALRVVIEAELDAIDGEMSTWRTDSDLVRFGAAPAGTWVSLPVRTCTVLRVALDVARESDGAFDPTVAPIVDVWGFGPARGAAHAGTAPREAARAHARARTGWARLSLDGAARRALQPGGVSLDFSGIAKGYAVDRVCALLDAHGAPDHLVEIGGELRGAGHKADGSPWWVGIERPPLQGTSQAADAQETWIALHRLAVATSGNYRRCAVIDGIEQAHTVDPRTGEPVRNGVASVTVLHTSAMHADAWATALLVAGIARGIELAETYDLAALFVVRAPAGLRDVMTRRFRVMAEG